ncbi:MAG: rhodanese-like domain-containing protein, partial [Lysobacter sp.]|nr:rhodanese-like domain-containing protein [Lysobacter sp.]
MSVETITPAEARQRQQRGVLLVDVRESHEHATGHATDALCVSRTTIETDPVGVLPDPDAEVMLICQAGSRSMRCAEVLVAAGYRQVASVDGGTARWIAEGFPVTVPE